MDHGMLLLILSIDTFRASLQTIKLCFESYFEDLGTYLPANLYLRILLVKS